MLLTNVVYYSRETVLVLHCSDEWISRQSFMGTGMNHLNTGNHLHTSWKYRPNLWAARTGQISGFQGTVLDNWQCLQCIHDQTRTLQCGISPCWWTKTRILGAWNGSLSSHLELGKMPHTFVMGWVRPQQALGWIHHTLLDSSKRLQQLGPHLWLPPAEAAYDLARWKEMFPVILCICRHLSWGM